MFLSIDTSNNISSVAIGLNSQIRDFIIDDEKNKQAEKIFQNIDIILARNNIRLHEIKEIYVSKGPGSFTGIRIGLSAALGFKIVSQLKIFAMSNLEIVARNINDNNDYVIVANAGPDLFYYADKSNFADYHNYRIITQDELKAINSNVRIISLDFMNESSRELINAKTLANAFIVLGEAKINYRDLSALYLKEPDIKAQKSKLLNQNRPK